MSQRDHFQDSNISRVVVQSLSPPSTGSISVDSGVQTELKLMKPVQAHMGVYVLTPRSIPRALDHYDDPHPAPRCQITKNNRHQLSPTAAWQ